MRAGVVPAAGFRCLTPLYDALCAVLGFGGAFRERLVRDLAPARGERILDIGCGTGVLVARVAPRASGGLVVGADPDAGALRRAARRSRDAGVPVNLCVATGERLPFRDGAFDRIVSSLALHHVPDAAKGHVLRETRRVLRPGGTLLLADFDTASSVLVFRGRRSRLPLARWLAEAGWDGERLGTWRRVHIWRARRVP